MTSLRIPKKKTEVKMVFMNSSRRLLLPCSAIFPQALLLCQSTRALSSLGEARSAAHHLFETFPSLTLPATRRTAVEELSNLHVPRRDGGTILAYEAKGGGGQDDPAKVLFLLHEFFGLSQSICDKADALAGDVGCTVIAPDTFRGQSSTFIPKCIWLALSTPQDRVNQDLDDVLKYYKDQEGAVSPRLAVMGFCYGGGKAIRYTCERQTDAATVVCYGSPVIDVDKLKNLKKPVCGVFGSQDFQFPSTVLQAFERGLREAGIPNCDIKVYEGVGHAFWKDMDQVKRKEQPQYDAYQQVVSFLKRNM